MKQSLTRSKMMMMDRADAKLINMKRNVEKERAADLEKISEFVGLLRKIATVIENAIFHQKKDYSMFKSDEEREFCFQALDLLYQYYKATKEANRFDKNLKSIISKLLDIINFDDKESMLMLQKILETNPFAKDNYFISEDLFDFITTKDAEHDTHQFWGSFWKTCASMLENGVDLSDKQLGIIQREYDKVKKDRIDVFIKKATEGEDNGSTTTRQESG